MNERIKELIWETDEWLESNAQSDRWEREIKFAELIVQECAELFPEIYYYSGLAVKRNIKQHFGVEE
jgi:hypothetical protein